MQSSKNHFYRYRSRVLILVLIFGIVPLAVVALLPQVSAGAGRLLSMACSNCAYRADHGTYVVSASPRDHNPNRYYGGVTFDERSVEGITAFARMNREAAPALFARHDSVRTLVTFSRPLSFAEFNGLITQSGITVHEVGARNRDAQGNRTTAFGRPDSRNLSDEAAYQSMLPSGEKFVGFFSADVTLTAATYAKLAQSPDVYLLDVTDALARDELKGRYDLVDVHRSSPFWTMEDLGLAKQQ
jgi:hypothetical protein